VLSLFVGGVLYGMAALQPQAIKLVEQLPAAVHNLQSMLHRTSLDRSSAIEKLSAAAEAIQSAAAGAPSSTRTPAPPPPGLNLREYLWAGSSAALTATTQAIIVLALSYFLLISDHAFKRKLVRITGTTLSQKKITVKILAEIDEQIQRYLLLQIGLSAVDGIVTGAFLAAVGLDNALFWGAAAGVLHMIPYLGPSFSIAATSVFAFLQFKELSSVLVVGGGSLLIVGVIGFVVMPWLTGRTARISAIATFVSLLLWDWLWGVPGLLLGVPIMMAAMAVCERVDRLRPIAELMHRD
jgi:predicted PurR-regulated permease PerM